jgi:hypothetical protein
MIPESAAPANLPRHPPAASDAREQELADEVARLQILIACQAELHLEHQAQQAAQAARLDAALEETASRMHRLQTLDAEQRAMKASRSWRWTAWLRSIERTWGSRP